MEYFTLTLPRIQLECTRCHHTWQQGTPRWDRGHLLMKRGNQTVYVMDDLAYQLGERIDLVVEPLLREIGYSHFVTPCRGCGHGDVRVAGNWRKVTTYGNEDFPCVSLDGDDMMKVGAKWQFRPEAIEALTR